MSVHPALRLSNFGRLPPSMRRTANAACATNRSVQDVRRVQAYMATATEDQSIAMLPVFYVNLDPVGIPDEATFDTDAPSLDVQDLIGRAFLSLGALYSIKFPPEIGPDIWPRAWPWIRFLYLYRDHLPGIPPESETVFCLGFLMFAGEFVDHPETHALILASPGFHFMVAKAWCSVPTLVDPKKREVAFGDLRNFIVDDNIAEPGILAELVDGAGGTLDDLAGLVVLYIEGLVPPRSTAMHFTSVHFFCGILDFITTVDPCLGDPAHMVGPMSAFGTSLLAQHIVRALSTTVCALSVTTTTQAVHALDRAFIILGMMLSAFPGYCHIPEALDHKILRALINCPPSPTGEPRSYVKIFFDIVLPPHLVYYPVISALDLALADVADLVDTTPIKMRAIHEQWEKFVTLARERLDVFHSYNAGQNPSIRACDNVKCSEIGAKSRFKRCRGCQSCYYCSEACQSLDWRKGGHRAACSSYGTLSLSGQNDFPLTTRERSFLRAVVHADYQKSKVAILSRQIVFMHMQPGEGFLILYDYSQGAAKITLQQLSGASAQKYLNGAEWENIVSHVARSGGHMRLDVIVIRGAGQLRYWAIPMRTNTPVVYKTLQQLASELPADREDWDDDLLIDRLMTLVNDDDPDVLEVH
ncbi:hypothetical protein FB451DRAFT_1368209 [Mycena latifolia]|nr:hypothetical protein FB451DRAFT_1368209 [Mycena latifolia]